LVVVEGYSGDGWLGLLIAPILYYDITRDFEGTLHRMIAHELKSAKSKGPTQPQQQANTVLAPLHANLKTVEDVVAFIKSFPGLEDVAEGFATNEMDGPAVRSMIKHWNAGTLRFGEVQQWFGIKTAGKLFRLKAALDGHQE
jgi:hypothetical protein